MKMTNGKKDILIITGRYLPGYKDGGPVRTLKNLTDYLGEEYNFRILTCDRDHGDQVPYPDIVVNGWNRVGKADVYYVPPGCFSAKIIKRLSSEADLVYVTGCFSDYSIKTLILNRFGQIAKPVIVVPMGLFMPNAMKRKPIKYNCFITVFKLLGMFRKVTWSVTSEIEENCVRKVISKRAVCYIARDLPRKVKDEPTRKTKETGALRVFFISRISPEKNLFQSIEILKQCKSKIHYTIYGPIHNKKYWEQVQLKMKELPDNVQAEYGGNLESEFVVETLEKEHVFLFTTIGENYSHVIHEALSAGCPCVISDQTPWQDLEEYQSGCVLSLHDNKGFTHAIDRYAKMTECEFQKISESAHNYAIRVSNESAKTTGYRHLFDSFG